MQGKKRWKPVSRLQPWVMLIWPFFTPYPLQIREDLKSGLIIVRIEWRDPKALRRVGRRSLSNLPTKKCDGGRFKKTGAALAVLETIRNSG